MRAFVLSILLFCCAFFTASAQSLSVFDLDTSAFPLVKAKFFAFDHDGDQVAPSPSEISVTEDGAPRTVISAICSPVNPPRGLSTVFAVGVWGSQQYVVDGNGSTDLAASAIKAWVRALPSGQNECAISIFSYTNSLKQDLTADRGKLLAAATDVRSPSESYYDCGFLSRPAGGLQISKNGKYQRVVVLIVDDKPQGGINVPAIVAEAKRQGCIIYAITMTVSCPQGLKDITAQTGGEWFERITAPKQAEDAAMMILRHAQGRSAGEITWRSGAFCVPGQRAVSVAWNGARSQESYPSAGAELEFSPATIFLSSKPVGRRFDATITITSPNDAAVINDITSSDPAFDINPKSFSLPPGGSRVVTLSYTPPDSGYHWAKLDFRTDACTQSYYASGGFPGVGPSVSTLNLTQPNGGEILAINADTAITWSGIPPTDTVKLELSSDSGKTWSLISNSASGGRFPWHVPNIPSAECLARATHLEFSYGSNWARRMGGSADDANVMDRSICTDLSGNIYVTGWFDRTIGFDSVTLPEGNGRVFVAKYRPDGTVIWARQDGAWSLGDAEGNGVAVDDSGNVYVVGGFNTTAFFDGVILYSKGAVNIFLAKYHPDGSLAWAKRAGSQYDDVGSAVTVDHAGNIYITGYCQSDADFNGIIPSSGEGGSTDIFVAKYHSDGSVEWARRAGGTAGDHGQSIVTDSAGNIYVAGQFSRTAYFDGIPLTVSGDDSDYNNYENYDFFVAKYRPDGSVAWAQSGGGKSLDAGFGVAVDNSGSVYVTGEFRDSANFSGIELAMRDGDSAGHFVARYSPDGQIAWARWMPGTDMKWHGEGGLALDGRGDIYVTGAFHGAVDLGDGIALSTPGDYNAFVAKYRPDGSTVWARQAGGNGYDHGKRIAIDKSETIYLTGSTTSKSAIFGNDTLSAIGQADFFLWKLAFSADTVQRDTSALFSIVRPTPRSIDVEMGQALIGDVKDSIVTAFISNPGTVPFTVVDLEITGADSTAFSLVSLALPFVISPGDSSSVEFAFHPLARGLATATIQIITQSDTLVQSIRGEGVEPALVIRGKLIDFGGLDIGSDRDTTLSLVISNVGAATVEFSAASQLGPDTTQFALVSGGGAFSLAPGESRTVGLRFAPRSIGRASGSLGFHYRGLGSPAVLQLFGQGIGGRVSIADDSAFAGQRRDIALRMEHINDAYLHSATIAGFRARIRYDHTALMPASGDIATGKHYDTLVVTGSLADEGMVAHLPFAVMPGGDALSTIDIVGFEWLNRRGEPVTYDVETGGGIFHRMEAESLFNPADGVALRVFPNPVNNGAEVAIELIETGHTRVTVINVLGQEVATLFDGDLVPGGKIIPFATGGLAPGSYYVMLSTPTIRRVERVEILK